MNRDKGAGKRAARTALAYVLTLFMILSVMPAPVVRASGAVVYLDGENGSDENSGADSDNAVASFYQAEGLLGGSGTIIVTNTLTVSGERDWYSESDVVLKASDYLDGPVIRIKEGGSLSIGGVTVSGGDVLIKNSGSLNLDGVTLRVWGEKVSAPEGIVTTDSGVTMLYGETLDGSSDDGQDSGEEWTEASGESEDGQGEGWTEASGESEGGQSEGWTEASEESSEKQSENAAEESEKSTGSQGQDMTETQAAEQTEAKPEASEAQTETSGKQTEAQTETSGKQTEAQTEESEKSTEAQSETTGKPSDSQTEAKPESEKSTEAHGEGWTEVTEGSSEGESEAVTEKQSESQPKETEPAGQESGSQSESQAAGSEGQTETETESETEAKDPVTAFMDATRALQVSSRDDVMQVLAVSKMFDRLTEEELSQVSQGAIEALWTAQSISSELNKTQSGVTVIGDFPWFVQFRVVLRDKSETASSEEGMDIIAPYELCLWNLYDDIPYYLPEGQQVTVMIPAPQGENAQEPVIFHYKADGSYEKIIPRQENGMLVFETSSFSPFSIAGSTVISGIGINGQTADSPGKGSGTKDETEKKDNTTGGTSKPGNATPGGNSTGGSSTGSGSTGGTNTGSTGTQNNNTTPQTTPSTGTGSSGQGQNNSGTVKSNTGAPRTADETDIFLYVMMAAGAVLLMAGALFASRRKLEDL